MSRQRHAEERLICCRRKRRLEEAATILLAPSISQPYLGTTYLLLLLTNLQKSFTDFATVLDFLLSSLLSSVGLFPDPLPQHHCRQVHTAHCALQDSCLPSGARTTLHPKCRKLQEMCWLYLRSFEEVGIFSQHKPTLDSVMMFYILTFITLLMWSEQNAFLSTREKNCQLVLVHRI